MSLNTSAFALPLRAPLRTAAGEVRVRRGFLARIADGEGRTGLGEACPLPPWTEDVKACGAALEAAADHLDAPVEDPEEALTDLDAYCRPLAKAPAARHALALALLDLAAQADGQPLGAYLARSRLGRDADTAPLPVNAVLGAAAPEAVAEAAQSLVQAGFRCIKLKLAGSPGEDEACVAAVRGAIGGAELRLDPNAAWSLEDARARLAALRRYGIAYVEQPVAGVEDLAELRKAGLVPVAADEAAATVAGARRVLDEGAADVLIVKPHALGGPDRAAEVLALAQQRGVPCVVTSLLDGPVGLLGARHVAALLPGPRPACGVAIEGLFERDPPGFAAEHGTVRLPSGPGLGFGGRR